MSADEKVDVLRGMLDRMKEANRLQAKIVWQRLFITVAAFPIYCLAGGFFFGLGLYSAWEVFRHWR